MSTRESHDRASSFASLMEALVVDLENAVEDILSYKHELQAILPQLEPAARGKIEKTMVALEKRVATACEKAICKRCESEVQG